MPEISTPHIHADQGDFAKTVLMPGDPLRSKFIAENYLDDVRLVNNVRNVQGYTGTYKGKPVTVMASGMGMPSIGIYAYELFHFCGVERIIRTGSAGGMQPNVKLHDLVFGMGAATNSNFGHQYGLNGTFAPICSYRLLQSGIAIAEEKKLPFHVGNILSSDIFYSENAQMENWIKMGVLAVEMEAAALYMTAAEAGKEALAICTVSDHLLTGETTTSDERRGSFRNMMEVALEIAIKD